MSTHTPTPPSLLGGANQTKKKKKRTSRRSFLHHRGKGAADAAGGAGGARHVRGAQEEVGEGHPPAGGDILVLSLVLLLESAKLRAFLL